MVSQVIDVPFIMVHVSGESNMGGGVSLRQYYWGRLKVIEQGQCKRAHTFV